MIHYKSGSGAPWNHFLNLFQMKGSGFPQAFFFAAIPGALTLYLKLSNAYDDGDILHDNTAWGGFSFLVGFLVVFRTSQAYSRFWDGCTSTHHLRAEWLDAASSILAFCKHSKADPKQIFEFKHVVVRLFSLLHMFALAHIEECEDMDDMEAHDLELIDPAGLDPDTWTAMKECKNRVTLVFQWIQCIIVENINTGVLSIPPPILSRVFQELANGMVALHDAHKISSIPFPFPYAQTCDALLILHSCITPFVTAEKVKHPVWATCLAFIQVFILWSLNYIAVEIEHPFGSDANDLNAAEMQLDMNMSLLLMLHPACDKTPQLTEHAVTRGLTRLGRGASQSVAMGTSSRTFNELLQMSTEKRVDGLWRPSAEGLRSSVATNNQSHVSQDSARVGDKSGGEAADFGDGKECGNSSLAGSDGGFGSEAVAENPPSQGDAATPGDSRGVARLSVSTAGGSRSIARGNGHARPKRSSMVQLMGQALQGPHHATLATSKLADPKYGASFWDMCEEIADEEAERAKRDRVSSSQHRFSQGSAVSSGRPPMLPQLAGARPADEPLRRSRGGGFGPAAQPPVAPPGPLRSPRGEAGSSPAQSARSSLGYSLRHQDTLDSGVDSITMYDDSRGAESVGWPPQQGDVDPEPQAPHTRDLTSGTSCSSQASATFRPPLRPQSWSNSAAASPGARGMEPAPSSTPMMPGDSAADLTSSRESSLVSRDHVRPVGAAAIRAPNGVSDAASGGTPEGAPPGGGLLI